MRGKVAIIGTGLIGRGWAAAFARGGWDVALWDATPGAAQAAVPAIARAIDDLAALGLVDDARGAKKSVRLAQDLREALDGADYGQESIPERVDLKRDLFLAMDGLACCDETILGSSTSTFAGSRFLSDVPGRARCIVAHPANPPHLMPAVEVAPSPWHDAETVERTCALLASIGQVPVVVHHEIEGFVMNRLQTAVVNEAISLVAKGVVDPAGLDAIMKHSLGLRWAFMGPFETMDMNAPSGFLDYATRYGALYEAMGRDLHVADPWDPVALQKIEDVRRAATPSDAVADRMLWRDRALMRLMALKNTVNEKPGQETA